MNEETLKTIVYQLLKKVAPDTEPSELKPDANIRETLNIDSFDTLQFIISLNEKLAIEIPEEDYGKITNMKSLIQYIMDGNNFYTQSNL